MKCKYCGKTKQKHTGHKEFCNQTCYQSYRYHNVKGVKKRVNEAVRKTRLKKYNSDPTYRKKVNELTKRWQKSHPENMRKNAMKWLNKHRKAVREGVMKCKV